MKPVYLQDMPAPPERIAETAKFSEFAKFGVSHVSVAKLRVA
jgi:hypothetical protein